MTNIEMGEPGGSEPSALTEEVSSVAERAARLLEQAAHPRWNLVSKSGSMEWHTEDTKTADREAQIGLGLAMLDLAAALRQSAAFGKGDAA